MEKNITVYGKPNCSQCDLTKGYLKVQGIKFNYIDVTVDAAALNLIQERGYQQLPVVSIDDFDVAWSGHCIPALVRLAMWDGE
nr:MAG TPA: glutaredoxin-like protein [Caudoviricetes sp.]